MAGTSDAMKKEFAPLFLLLLLSFSFVETHREDTNSIKGSIELMDCSGVIEKGSGYNKDGTEVMHSMDAMATPERNVIISIHPLDFNAVLNPTQDAYISQKEQTFLPLVLPVVVGSKVHFLNEDEFFHNVQSYTSKSRFSIGRRAPGISYSQKIKKEGVIHLLCDIHSHMKAVILSLDTPYFTRVDEDGSYEIKGLPDGQYRIQVYHPSCGNLTDEVAISGGETQTINYNYSIKP